ncbi:MAG: tRNA pseudouridine(38-40) synthase TruA [Chlorobiaceae bacterium]|nr:tRNA pseudouridine(38-40) synthase TruA [Chlorobiaceae bacterium]MBA4309995.1 tRNA pseudouridine(38-40) synthase TruA [Chlorobiaceae bacterium]
MNNYKLIIQYDGTDFCGWQIQRNEPSIQGEISNAIETILREKINLIGAGRTDAGVHALGQTANFKSEVELDFYRFKHQLNSILPKSISITEIANVEEKFNSRSSAKKRIYFYLITNIKSPFYFRYSHFQNIKYNVDKLNLISKKIIGTYDFSAFTKNVAEVENTICTVKNAWWKETKNFYIFMIEGNRFLHGMVRSITGTILNIHNSSGNENEMSEILGSKERKNSGESLPAKGLFLYKIKY